ncbi:ATP-binding protein [Desulfosporosinus sp. SB140]|uniref:ATP-binding protein n=1 Tax=Desulfosporosinus paludis TaxID=3115649 RepID=UPI00388D1ED2
MGFFQLQHDSDYNKDTLEKIIILENFDRTKRLSAILFLTNFILLLIDYNNRLQGLWSINEGYNYLYFSHVVLGLVTFFYIVIFYRIKAYFTNEITSVHKLYVISFAIFILNLTAVISGLIDQKIHGQIIVYVMACITIAVTFNYRLRVTALLYGSSYTAMMTFLTISLKDPNIRQGDYINTSLIVIISFFLSALLYKVKQQELIHYYYLEDLVNERTKELQAANQLLSQEIVERKRAEIEMVRMDRLNLIGQMAASISHEVRNPMTTVKGFLQLLKKKQELKDQEYFDLMIEELDRANSILSEFLSISRNKPTLFERYNLNDLVTSTLPLIEADAQYNDNLLTVDLNNVPDLQLDTQEIRQLLLNLVRNGFEAMSGGGKLTIKTYFVGREVALVVADQGKGIEQSVLEKLGTPFFTTKEQGTGLGLAVCYGIVSRHNARISVETGLEGTTFYVYFEIEAELVTSMNQQDSK